MAYLEVALYNRIGLFINAAHDVRHLCAVRVVAVMIDFKLALHLD